MLITIRNLLYLSLAGSGSSCLRTRHHSLSALTLYATPNWSQCIKGLDGTSEWWEEGSCYKVVLSIDEFETLDQDIAKLGPDLTKECLWYVYGISGPPRIPPLFEGDDDVVHMVNTLSEFEFPLSSKRLYALEEAWGELVKHKLSESLKPVGLEDLLVRFSPDGCKQHMARIDCVKHPSTTLTWYLFDIPNYDIVKRRLVKSKRHKELTRIAINGRGDVVMSGDERPILVEVIDIGIVQSRAEFLDLF